MQYHTHNWENALLSLAQEGRHLDVIAAGLQVEATHLHHAYAHCDAMTAQHSRSFHLASSLLPPDKRRAVRSLYAFCRMTDDLVDRELTSAAWSGATHQDQRAALTAWRQRVLSNNPVLDDWVALAWADTRLRYHVPLRYAEQLIEGVGRDLVQVRYQTFEELTAYCYGVASTVGLMSMHIIGYAGLHAIPYAIKLGVALQLTNILRDVGEDWQAGRLYLPLADLAHFGIDEAEIAAGVVTPQWRRFMQYQIERNRRLYAEAMPGIALLNRDGRFAIAAAAELYRAILQDIEAHDYDVFHRRAAISKWGKLRRLPGVWWRCL